MQHALTLLNFKQSMHHGDSGRLLVSLSLMTVWFRGSRQHRYATETLHLTACLHKLWKLDYKRWLMDSCLVNPSRRQDAFMACDYLGEYIVHEAQDLSPANYNESTAKYHSPKYHSEVISPQLMFFREVRKRAMQETGAPNHGYRSS